MHKIDLNGRYSKKMSVIIIVSIVIFVLLAMIAIAAGHNIYIDKQAAQITNSSDFRVINPRMFIYIYSDETKSIDMQEIVAVSKGASFNLTKVIDENGAITKPNGFIIDVSENPQRDVMVQVKSASGKKVNDYKITLVSKALSSNMISAQLGRATLSTDLITNYSGTENIVLPTPKLTYTTPVDNTKKEYEFLGWYTTPNYMNGTEITVVEAGMSGEINLYPKFASPVPTRESDGFTYVTLGKYPQTRVTDYSLLKLIRASSEYTSLGNANGVFTYGGQSYYKFKPSNQPNVIDNGYSSSSYYVFYVEDLWWRVLTRKNANIVNGSSYTLLCKDIINCAPFNTDDDGWLEKKYTEYADKFDGDLTSFIRRYFDMDTIYYDSNLRSTITGIYSNVWFTSTEQSYMQTTTFTRYTSPITSGTETYGDKLIALSYSEMRNINFGFNADDMEMDSARVAAVTDFAAAQGVYKSTSKAFLGKGSWWLRGAGSTFSYNDKKIAYVKYSGKLHSYTAKSYKLRSGVRPAVKVTYWGSNN